MPQKSYGYAAGRVQVLSKGLLGASQLDRLASSQTIEEVARTLGELGWGDVRTKRDIERVAAAHVREAAGLVREISPDTRVTDCFLVKYDVLNLKLLIKARVLNRMNDITLSENGLIDPARLKRMVEECRYGDLPPALRRAMEEIEKHIAVKIDPLHVDALLDQAMYELIFELINPARTPELRSFFVERVDMINLMTALRVAEMGRGGAFARALFIPGGTISFDALAQAADDSSRAANAVAGKPFARSIGAIVKQTPVDLAALEKATDDYLLRKIRAHKNETATILPLVGYLMAREREAGDMRMIATAKASGVSAEALGARLRALY